MRTLVILAVQLLLARGSNLDIFAEFLSCRKDFMGYVEKSIQKLGRLREVWAIALWLS
jgi:hypothetical protein